MAASGMQDAAVRASAARGRGHPRPPAGPDRRAPARRAPAARLDRYYLAAGAGGLAVGVHTTQFAIRDPRHGLFEPVLALAAEETGPRPTPAGPSRWSGSAGICGPTGAGGRRGGAGPRPRLPRRPAEPRRPGRLRRRGAARPLPRPWPRSSRWSASTSSRPSAAAPARYAFWRRFAEIEDVVAIKIAPFNRYRTLDVVRAVVRVPAATTSPSTPATTTTSWSTC